MHLSKASSALLFLLLWPGPLVKAQLPFGSDSRQTIALDTISIKKTGVPGTGSSWRNWNLKPTYHRFSFTGEHRKFRDTAPAKSMGRAFIPSTWVCT